ncbi:polyphosphate kinase 1 [Geminisphaera colitermitum]|uniref:polyphosphate kinase 1 n=1 Tax=Geminisphaera colitermitum TaxID=1148786 RepID=UPI000158C778|nr:polyphosphate kinase 1 [Geminisphaera colitermitum]
MPAKKRPISRAKTRARATAAAAKTGGTRVLTPTLHAEPIAPVRHPVKTAYFNRELSWLAFNRRVLDQAFSEKHPLFERIKFLAIVSSNLDEFFEIRVAGLIQQVESGVTEPSFDGLGPKEQLRRIHSVVASLVEDQYRCWHQQLLPALAGEGIVFKNAKTLTPTELAWVRTYFEEQVYPVLTPLGLDQSHPFPQLGNKTLNVVVCLDDPDSPEGAGGAGAGRRIVILPVPRILPRYVAIENADSNGSSHIFLSEIIKLCAGSLFPGYTINNAHSFRVTRNSDLYIDEEEADNLLKTIEEELRNLRRGAAVRLEIEDGVADDIFKTLCDHLSLSHEYVFRLSGAPINLLRVMSLADLERPDLKYVPFTPAAVSPLRDTARIFDTIDAQDILLHHPYDSFQPVVDFVTQAARDPRVFAIKQTLYRTSGDSPIVRALSEASHNGKQVTALVELKARGDEANNIQWARQLEEAGVHVVYGLIGHKTHCKCSLVVRREAGGRLRRYVHLGTGNYNPKTARLYTDLSYFTASEDITADTANLFNSLTGFSRAPEFDQLLVAPFSLHRRIQELIAAETANAAAGRPARIFAKMNSLVDKATIDSLYAASRAGVKIDLIIRGICCLVPGIRGLSENITVRSIVGRYLEHARVFYFENAGGSADPAQAQPLIYAGSADWMPRNFFRRIEVLFPIRDPALRRWVTDELIAMEMADNEYARVLHSSGAYLPVTRAADALPFSAQSYFVAAANQRICTLPEEAS